MTKFLREDGFDFCFDPTACRSCAGRCCRGKSGHIWVNAVEIEHIVAYLQTNTIDFVTTYLIRVGNRLSLKEKKTEKDYACTFFDVQTNQCTIYAVRPSQCRKFPFWDSFKSRQDKLKRECPGVKACE